MNRHTFTAVLSYDDSRNVIVGLEALKRELLRERAQLLHVGDTVGAGAVNIEINEIVALRNRLRDLPHNPTN